jgi:hypothetical protein
MPTGALLVVTGDHGTVNIRGAGIDVAERDDLRHGVIAITGDPRARQLHCEQGAGEGVLVRWRAALGQHAWVLTRDEAIAAGWFGPVVSEAAHTRLGDVVVASAGDAAVYDSASEPGLRALPGQHGSLLAEEEVVPLITWRASQARG